MKRVRSRAAAAVAAVASVACAAERPNLLFITADAVFKDTPGHVQSETLPVK